MEHLGTGLTAACAVYLPFGAHDPSLLHNNETLSAGNDVHVGGGCIPDERKLLKTETAGVVPEYCPTYTEDERDHRVYLQDARASSPVPLRGAKMGSPPTTSSGYRIT